MVATRTETFENALDALAGFGRPDRLTVGAVDSEDARRGRSPFLARLPRPVTQKAQPPRLAELETRRRLLCQRLADEPARPDTPPCLAAGLDPV